jgi:hypothetical protein
MLATRAGELAVAAPIVVAARTARMLRASGATPNARDQAELLRMTSEKVVAFGAAWLAIAGRLHRMQIEWLLGASRAWLDAWRYPHRMPGPARRSVMSTGEMHALVNAALAPVHRIAVGNARRLSRRRR